MGFSALSALMVLLPGRRTRDTTDGDNDGSPEGKDRDDNDMVFVR